MGELLDWANAGSKQLRSGAVPSSDDDNMPLSQRMLASSDDTELDASDGYDDSWYPDEDGDEQGFGGKVRLSDRGSLCSGERGTVEGRGEKFTSFTDGQRRRCQ